MAVTLKDVEHVARLARLSFTADQQQRLTVELNSILHYMDQLNALDTSGVVPLEQVVESANVFRPDELRPGLSREEALQNAPAHNGRFFKVPKVISDR